MKQLRAYLPPFYLLAGAVGIITAFGTQHANAARESEAGLDGLVGGLLVASAILFASAATILFKD